VFFWIPVSDVGIGTLHHKFCVLDSDVVITGSFNWTRTASKADENIIVVRHHELIVRDFEAEFRVLLDKYGHDATADSNDAKAASVGLKIGSPKEPELQSIAQLRAALRAVVKEPWLAEAPVLFNRFQEAFYGALAHKLTATQIDGHLEQFKTLMRAESPSAGPRLSSAWWAFAMRLQGYFPFSSSGRVLELMCLQLWDSDNGDGGLEVDTWHLFRAICELNLPRSVLFSEREVRLISLSFDKIWLNHTSRTYDKSLWRELRDTLEEIGLFQPWLGALN
jgi:PLD-like domain